MGGPTVERTITVKPVQCPVCKTMNAPGHWYCVECGLIFAKELDGDAFGAPAVRLPVLLGEGGRPYILRPGRQTLGRAGDVVVDDPRVSRLHAAVTLEGDAATVEDLGSTNGTSVDGDPLAAGTQARLGPGGKLSLGGLELAFALPGEAGRTVQPGSGRTAALAVPPGKAEEAAAVLLVGSQARPLAAGTYTVGRREGNDIVVSDPFVSGSHGTVEVEDGAVYFTDTGSTNGSVLNGERLEPGARAALGPGDVLLLGQVEVRLEG